MLLKHSLKYQWEHSSTGHSFFLAGQFRLHSPIWTLAFITITKLSLCVTIPAAGFVIYHLVRVISRYKKRRPLEASAVFLLCWLLGIAITFSQLNIVVGTHYELPIAVPAALAAAASLQLLINYMQRRMKAGSWRKQETKNIQGQKRLGTQLYMLETLLPVLLCSLLLAGPHLAGLLTNYAAEGYTSELFQGENTVSQVAYPGYREGANWLAAHTQRPARIGLVALVNTLNQGEAGVSWYGYNNRLPNRLSFSEADVESRDYQQYDYLIWPMHLVQRGYALPAPESMHIVHIITGGQTIYCYILARSTVSISQ
jgi:hypothetical protein